MQNKTEQKLADLKKQLSEVMNDCFLNREDLKTCHKQNEKLDTLVEKADKKLESV